MRDLLVKLLREDAFADGGPLTEVVDGELAGQRACRGDDEVFEYAARHCCELLTAGGGEVDERRREDLGYWWRDGCCGVARRSSSGR